QCVSMDVCYMCGTAAATCEVQATPNPSAPHEPYFPSLMCYECPRGAKPPSVSGSVRTCAQCRHQLLASWRQPSSTDEASAQWLLQQQIYMSMLKSAGMTGPAGGGASASDFFTPSSAYGPEALMRLAQLQQHQQQQQQHHHHQHQQHQKQQQQQQQQAVRSAANSSAGSSSRASPSVGAQQIRCFLCRKSMAKQDAKIVYATRVSDNCEHFPFLKQLVPPPEALPLTQGATKLCLQCHSSLAEQYRHYEIVKTPQDSRVYQVVSEGGQTKFYCNTGTLSLSCPLCGDSFKDTPIWLSWKPTASSTGGGGNSSSTPFYPLLSKVTCEYSHLLIDKQRGRLLACRTCCDHLHQQWTQQERLPPQSRYYQLRRTPPSQPSPAGGGVAASPGSNPGVRPMIAQCHVCLCALHNPETLKLLRHKPKSGRPASPYFPFLANLRHNSQASANGTFPVCDLCYTNLRWQWIRRSSSSVNSIPDAASASYQTEYICSGCLQLKTSKEEVRLQGDCLLCLDCATIGGRAGASGSSGGRERVTVTVPPITRSSETRPAMASTPIASAAQQLHHHHGSGGGGGGGYSDALRNIAAKNAAAAAAAAATPTSSAMDNPSMALGTLPPPGWLGPDQLAAYYNQMIGYSYQYQMLQALASAYPPYPSDPASLAMLYGYHQQQHRPGHQPVSASYPPFSTSGAMASSASSSSAAAAAAAAMMMMDSSQMMSGGPAGYYTNSAMGAGLLGHQSVPARPAGAAKTTTVTAASATAAKPPTPAKSLAPTAAPSSNRGPGAVIPSSPSMKTSRPPAASTQQQQQHEDALDLSRKPGLPAPVIRPPFLAPAAVSTRPAGSAHKMFRPFEDSDDESKPTPPKPSQHTLYTASQHHHQQHQLSSLSPSRPAATAAVTAGSPKPPTLSPQQSRVDAAASALSAAAPSDNHSAAAASGSRVDTDSSEEGNDSPAHTPDLLRRNLKEKSNFLRKFHLRPLSHAQKICHRQTRQLVRKYLRRIRKRSKAASRLATSRILRRLEVDVANADHAAAVAEVPEGNGSCNGSPPATADLVAAAAAGSVDVEMSA
ncbi:hypothetical protein BOX15_Mlig015755g3, partial [Macrostomum lignano]